ncbi:MAG: glucosamine-6-phosphate deaminase [Lachnospiraceae bacterium]|nr:glucosamine-6-phosphate deaminase [Lachnospiraceae bacterium]
MRIIKAKDYADVSLKAAGLLAAQVMTKPDSVLGLATGSSPIGLYDRLIGWYQEGLLDFSGIETFNLDEYLGIERTNDQSYYYFMHEHLFDHVNLPKDKTHVLNGRAEDPEAECRAYDDAIRARGGIDLQLLGLGHDGHIAFNEPADNFPDGTHIQGLDPRTIEANARFFASEDDVPKQALTMGIGMIMRARKIVLVVNGADKADAVAACVNGPVTPSVPGSILQFHPDCTIIGDEAALSKL